MRYTIAAGRAIERDGKAIVYIGRVANDEGYAISPTHADDLARAFVAALNAAETVEDVLADLRRVARWPL